MRRWGYRHVITPMVESTDVLELGLGSEQRRKLFKFTDVGGEVVALVGERTVPVARLVAGKLRSTPLPLRLCYAGPVMSSDAGRFHQRRERYQVGAELVGARGTYADAEVIALAARCLEAAGLRRYQVDVGHAEFFQGIMDAVKLPDAVKAGVRAALAARDFVALEQLLERTALRSAEHELLLKFPALRGGTEILEAASGLVRNRRSEWALKELGRVRELLEVYGLGETVRLDLGAIRDFDYYTGIIFEGYGPRTAGGSRRPLRRAARALWASGRGDRLCRPARPGVGDALAGCAAAEFAAPGRGDRVVRLRVRDCASAGIDASPFRHARGGRHSGARPRGRRRLEPRATRRQPGRLSQPHVSFLDDARAAHQEAVPR